MKQNEQQLEDIRGLIQSSIDRLAGRTASANGIAGDLALKALVMANDASIPTHGKKRISRRTAALERKALIAHGQAVGFTQAGHELSHLLAHGILNFAYENKAPRLSRSVQS